MPDGQHPPERLRRYLKDLNPEARASLLADLEAGALRLDQLPEADLILGELRRMHTVPREHPSPQQLLFAPLTPFVIDDNPARKHPGRIARGSLEWIWQWIARDLAPAILMRGNCRRSSIPWPNRNLPSLRAQDLGGIGAQRAKHCGKCGDERGEQDGTRWQRKHVRVGCLDLVEKRRDIARRAES